MRPNLSFYISYRAKKKNHYETGEYKLNFQEEKLVSKGIHIQEKENLYETVTLSKD